MKEYLSKECIEQNRDYFVDLLSTIKRDGAKIDELITKLDNSDFFYAPATTQYYGAFPGGLCDHSICVFSNLLGLVAQKIRGTQKLDKDDPLFESCVIVGLLHDICKMNRFETYQKNVKNYNPNGKNSDGVNRFDWETVSAYQTKPNGNRFIYGSDGETSEYMIRQYIPLTLEESIAIINTKGDSDGNQTRGANLGSLFSKYELPILAHCADLLACYVDDCAVEKCIKPYEQPNKDTTETVQEG